MVKTSAPLKKLQVPEYWAASKVEFRSVAELKAYERNARLHSDRQIEEIAASIRQWGWTIPVLIDETNEIIAGHGRLSAAILLGLEKVPVVVARHWSDTQKRAYRIADNQLAFNANWNDECLKIELEALKDGAFDLTLIGFKMSELDRLMTGGEQGLTDPDAIPELPEGAVTDLGDLWLLGSHRLLCGDSTAAGDVQRVLSGDSPHLMVTDPPYGVSYDPEWRARAGVNKNRAKMGTVANDDRADWRTAWSLFPGDVAYAWHGALHACTVQESLIATGFAVRSQIIWVKDRFALSRGHYHWQHEPAFYAVRDKGHWHGDRRQSTVWEIPSRDDNGLGHGTQKPVECMRRPLLNNSEPGDLVYDPFVGSGTTIIAAQMSARKACALELTPEYVDTAIVRWQKFTGLAAVHAGTGRTFEETAKDRHGARDSAGQHKAAPTSRIEKGKTTAKEKAE